MATGNCELIEAETVCCCSKPQKECTFKKYNTCSNKFIVLLYYKLISWIKNLFKKPPQKETAKPRITEKKPQNLSKKELLRRYLKSKGYSFDGWQTKPRITREKPITPIQAMRKKMRALKAEGEMPKECHKRNKWGIRWLLPETRNENKPLIPSNGEQNQITHPTTAMRVL